MEVPWCDSNRILLSKEYVRFPVGKLEENSSAADLVVAKGIAAVVAAAIVRLAVRADAGAEGEEKWGTRRWGRQPSLLAGFLFRLGNNKQNRLMSYIPQYNIILKEMSRVTCNHHFPFADVLLSVHQFSAFKSTLKVSVVRAISALGPF
ncbi:hypothetical protein NC653_026963 [Populus alba x Populus x berolinensis]|uniref:Uncharacterized protein n=1 Tax=Populus alba x Populus x berolinensis TaxID=444605 RepID=A0AAD6M588_9ROSI|nr:hypothetical protein NC653_026963 [Populus alba x Populus x berolinensis]